MRPPAARAVASYEACCAAAWPRAPRRAQKMRPPPGDGGDGAAGGCVPGREAPHVGRAAR
ncbi:hypothetical protein WI26_23365 [Burkholderia diffusa]|nr:hypothetical protein WI26_23365 [Burkholderia diffusa]